MRNLAKFFALIAVVSAAAVAHAQGPPVPDWVPALVSPEEAAQGFYPLFNGKDLDGWRVRGENKEAFAIDNGELQTTGAGGGDWAFTVAEYENFVLRYEYRCHPTAESNSGVAIRAPEDGDPAFAGMEIQVLAPDEGVPDTGDAGAIYGVVAPKVRADKPAGEWNSVEVLCDGPRIRTVMNGQELYDIQVTEFTERDDGHLPLGRRPRQGHIALQDHGTVVWFRAIRIKPLPGGEGWRRLFNGKDLAGWKEVGDATWQVLEDGVLRVDCAPMTTRSELRTLEQFGDFELRLSIRPHTRANSGVFFRGTGRKPWPRTYEAQVDNHDPRQFTGAIWDQVPASELRAMDNCWFRMCIKAVGPHIEVAVNGKTVTSLESAKHDKCPSGWISLQAHDPTSIIDFKDIEIRPIAAKPLARSTSVSHTGAHRTPSLAQGNTPRVAVLCVACVLCVPWFREGLSRRQ